MQDRSPLLLQHYAPYAKLLLRATNQLLQQQEYAYEGPAYRCCSARCRVACIVALTAAVAGV